MAEVSVVVLTKNEQTNVAYCLESISGWAYRMLVVDSGSTDRTVELARAAGAQVFTHDFAHISEQRNWALENGGFEPGDWVLFLDADERATPAFRNAVTSAVVAAQQTDLVAFRVCFRLLMFGRWIRHASAFPAWHDRIVRVGYARFRNLAGNEGFEATGPVGKVPEPFDHHYFSKGFDDWFARHNYYSSREAQYIVSGSHKPGVPWRYQLRTAAAKLGPFRAFLTFARLFVIRCGFLDGPEGFAFSVLRATYDLMVFAKVFELERLRSETVAEV